MRHHDVILGHFRIDSYCGALLCVLYNTLYSTGHRQRQNETRTKRVCFSSANVGVVFSLSLETRRKSPLLSLVLCSDNLKSSVYY